MLRPCVRETGPSTCASRIQDGIGLIGRLRSTLSCPGEGPGQAHIARAAGGPAQAHGAGANEISEMSHTLKLSKLTTLSWPMMPTGPALS